MTLTNEAIATMNAAAAAIDRLGVSLDMAAKEIGRLHMTQRDLLAALRLAVEFIPEPTEDRTCHKGITTMKKCGRCSRAQQVYDAIARAEAGR